MANSLQVAKVACPTLSRGRAASARADHRRAARTAAAVIARRPTASRLLLRRGPAASTRPADAPPPCKGAAEVTVLKPQTHLVDRLLISGRRCTRSVGDPAKQVTQFVAAERIGLPSPESVRSLLHQPETHSRRTYAHEVIIIASDCDRAVVQMALGRTSSSLRRPVHRTRLRRRSTSGGTSEADAFPIRLGVYRSAAGGNAHQAVPSG